MCSTIARLRTAALGILICAAPAAHADDLQIIGTPLASGTVGQWYYFQPQIRGSLRLNARFQVANAPHWLLLSPIDGALYGVPTPSEVGVYPNITLSVSDGVSRVSLRPFTLAVTAPSEAGKTVLTWTAATGNSDGSRL